MNTNDDIIARPYQVDLLEKAVDKNTILFLPTGSGKTFVAIMLIKKLGSSIEKPYSEGGKRTFFLVNTVALVNQQAESIRRHAPYDVGEYSGDMNVDFWAHDKWNEELDKFQILVMTSQIFLNMLLHSYIELSSVNLLIFDECHHGVCEHPMRQIMQRFEMCPLQDQPRVLGLSATLIMGSCKANNVMQEVEGLERTFHSKIATVDELQTVRIFSTNPKESIVTFRPPPTSAAAERAFAMIRRNVDMLKLIVWPEPEMSEAPENSRPLYDKGKTGKKVSNQLNDLHLHIAMLGLYGGSRACLAHLLQLERKRVKTEDDLTDKIYGTLITAVSHIHKDLMKEMALVQLPLSRQIIHFSSDQVIALLKILEEHNQSRDDEFCCVVFVQRRFTAKVLYQILLSLSTADRERYSFIRPDFIVGLNNNPQYDTREGKLDRKHNGEVINRFNRGVCNLIVSSDVLEEGIDIRQLSLVVKFDKPMNHSSYIQSKGRARHEESCYKIMVPAEDYSNFLVRYQSYQLVEKVLQKQLVGKNDRRLGPTQEEIANDVYDQTIPPYYSDGSGGEGSSCITMLSAISLLNRYCSLLPQDKFTQLTPSWFINKDNDQVSLQLPMNCPLRDLILASAEMTNKRDGKRSAALEACKRLHQMGELDSKLLPKGRSDSTLDYEQEFFPLWQEEFIPQGEPRPGTHRKKRRLDRPYPAALTACRPQPDETSYLYAITLVPNYAMPTLNRRLVFYQLLKDKHSYAIVTSKRLPKTCSFSIYLNVGEVSVSVSSTPLELYLSAARIASLRRFNMLLFDEVLALKKPFLATDVVNEENSHVVVPTMDGVIDWPTVERHTKLPRIQKPSEVAQAAVRVDAGIMHAVLAPWYRGACGDQNYVVTRVCNDLTPLSPFPTNNENITYAAYFERKYSTRVFNLNQPLVEVKAISGKLQCLKPRPMASESESRTQSKRRREMNDDFEEHLVAELCVRFDFPASLWLKATCLPTVLHRLTHLLLAEELRVSISEALHLPRTTLPEGAEWEPLVEDGKRTTPKQNPESLLGILMAPKQAAKNASMWGDDIEPDDIERMPLEDVRLIDIQHFENFISKPLPPAHASIFKVNFTGPIVEINMLANTTNNIGPQQSEILQALTATTANDVVNLERCETLGDSYLKFAVSHFLFLRCANIDEGRLTHLKGRLLGNRNLLYCGLKQRVGGMMKVHDFAPKSDFIPPGMCVPRFIAKIIRLAEIPPQVLHKLSIPDTERATGLLSKMTVDDIQQQLLDSEEEKVTLTESIAQSTMETILGYQSVKDKTVADSVEALIGTYLRCCGVRGALRLLGWLRILPAEFSLPALMYDTPPRSALLVVGDVDHLLRSCGAIERQLGYRFRDRSYLLQALTHPSYEPNRITESYQRLEFLGDALLDFLVTCHIFERCGSLTPGELTDLRSSLVNNVYFACIVVRHGLYRYMLASSPKLMDMIDKFVSLQEERKHVVNDAVLHLVEEAETQIAEAVDVPKVLGDLFESIAGAVFLDSNMCLKTVWNVVYRLMHKEIEEFSRKVPKQPVRVLYEYLGQNHPTFHPTVQVPDSNQVMVTLEVKMGVGREPMLFHGVGDNKTLARTAAAKIAMKKLPTSGMKRC